MASFWPSCEPEPQLTRHSPQRSRGWRRPGALRRTAAARWSRRKSLIPSTERRLSPKRSDPDPPSSGPGGPRSWRTGRRDAEPGTAGRGSPVAGKPWPRTRSRSDHALTNSHRTAESARLPPRRQKTERNGGGEKVEERRRKGFKTTGASWSIAGGC